jgi:hypothetical protein
LFNFKVSGIAGGIALVLSLLLGLISGAGFLMVILRAFIFGALFFVLFCLIFWVLGQFVPEILTMTGDDLDEISGSKVNLTVGETIEGAFPTGNFDEIDSIDGKKAQTLSARAAAVSGAPPAASAPAAMDLEGQSGYNTERGDIADGTPEFLAGNSGNAGDAAGAGVSGPANAEAIPDFDVLSGAFVNSSGGGEEESADFETPPEPRRPLRGGGKSSAMGDFNPKELAMAIQTVLKKEEKG